MRRTCPDIHEFYPNFLSPVAPAIEDLAILALDAISFTDHPVVVVLFTDHRLLGARRPLPEF
jgi:hypothetical protein